MTRFDYSDASQNGWSPFARNRARATTPRDRMVDEVERHLHNIRAITSIPVGAWAEAADLHLVDLHVLLALAAAGRQVGASELAERSGLSLEAVYPALSRLKGRGYAREEQRRHALTDDGHALVADLDRARREGIRSYAAQLGPDAEPLGTERFSRLSGLPGEAATHRLSAAASGER